MSDPLPASRYRIFVYGSLRPGQPEHTRICGGYTFTAVPAQTRGRILQLADGYPALTTGSDWIEGEVLCFDDPALLEAMDRWEVYDPAEPENSEYNRRACPVWDRAGQPLGTVEAYWLGA